MKHFKIITLGCKVNQFESEGLAHRLSEAGWTQAGRGGSVDLCLINTCAVTARAAMQGRQAIRRAIRSHPAARIVATGCHVQTEVEMVAAIEGVDLIVGHADKHRIPQIIAQSWDAPAAASGGGEVRARVIMGPLGREVAFAAYPAAPPPGRVRPYLKIQDGCDAFCAYCIVPHARGPSRSMPFKAVMAGLLELRGAGALEVVLTGIHMGRWGRDLAPAGSTPRDIGGLLSAIAAAPSMPPIRLSSIEADEITDQVVAVVTDSERFRPHFHVPLQSGDDTVLGRMGRPCNAAFYEERIHYIRERLPDAAIGADVLIGFPGETDAAFENTLALIERLPLSYLHVFPFSPRPGTPAATFSGRAHPSRIQRRCRIMRRVGERKKALFLQTQVGRHLLVAIEGRRDRATGLLKGMAENYVTVLVDGPDYLKNRLAKVKLKEVYEGCSLIGLLASSIEDQ